MSKKACKDKKVKTKKDKANFVCEKCKLHSKKKKHLCKPQKMAG